jgi:hypothetical protein
VKYSKTNQYAAISIKSLPEFRNILTDKPKKIQDEKSKVEEELDSVSRRTKSKRMFR